MSDSRGAVSWSCACGRAGSVTRWRLKSEEAGTLVLCIAETSLSIIQPHTAYLAVGKRASGVADPAVMSGCSCFSSVSRATLMTARDARRPRPPQALSWSWWKHKVTTMGKLGVGGEWPLTDLRRLTRIERVRRRWSLRLGGGPRSRSPGAWGTTASPWRWCL